VRSIRDATPRARALRVAVLAPPWITVPPRGYGGIESVVSEVTAALVRRGHAVTLFAPPGSRSQARVVPLLERDHPEEIGQTLFEADHAARAVEVIDAAGRSGRPFDVVHDHSGFALAATADLVDVPVLHTLHGPFTPDTCAFYRRHAQKFWVTALSHAQLRGGPEGLRCVKVIPNPIDLRTWRLRRRKERYLLWIGRMTPAKGAHRAIAAARSAGWPLVLAGPVQPGQERFFEDCVAPHIDEHSVRYVAEIGGAAKRELFARASALLMPIRWPEPFGMVMIEALACGTPVIAFPEGAAPEIVDHGSSGFLVRDEDEMAAAVAMLDELDAGRCRASVRERYDADLVASAYEEAYLEVMRAPAMEGR
jgi:glycosyltransferase involved in cell wall biosynthesis